MNALHILKVILCAIVDCCRPKYFVYRFEIITGEERGVTIDDTNVVSYRFINQGNTDADVNGMSVKSTNSINSLGTPLPGNDIDLGGSTYGNEIDTTLYKVRFSDPPPGIVAENCLLVISKCIATKRASQMVAMVKHDVFVKPKDKKKAPQKLPTYEEIPEYEEIEE